MLVALLFYGYATGVFSSRKLEKASYDSLAFRYVCANTHPDHDTIAVFRKRFLKETVNRRGYGATEARNSQPGWHQNQGECQQTQGISWEYANKLEAQLKNEVAELLRLAEEADQRSLPEEMNIPEKRKRRETRLAVIEQAKNEIRRRARARFERAQGEYDAKIVKRETSEKETRKKARGKKPTPPETGPQSKDQVNLTNEESRIVPYPMVALNRSTMPRPASMSPAISL